MSGGTPATGDARIVPCGAGRRLSARVAAGLSAAPCVPAAQAHGPDTGLPPSLAAAFSLDPVFLAALLLALVLYALGLRRRRSRDPIAAARAAAFVAGWCVLSLATVWPLDAYAAWSLAAHMTQHMLLLAVAAPLLVLGRPGAVWLAALPTRAARGLVRPLRGGAPTVWRALTTPVAATLLQAGVICGWHLPWAMAAALRSGPVHDLMHLSHLLAGVLFWTAVLHAPRGRRIGAGPVAIVGAMMPMGMLGALLTFADEPRYPHYEARAPLLGLTALEDQQLAGLIMWVPAALPYLVGGLALAATWLRDAPPGDDTRPGADEPSR